MKNKSFTLIEMLLTVVIIGIVSGILLFNTQDAFDQKNEMEILAWGESLKAKNQTSLVSEWTFDGSTTAGLAATNNDVRDSWGYNHGTVVGTITVKGGEECVLGKCLDFDGSVSYINFGQGAGNSLQIIGSQSVEFWVYPTDFTVRRSIIHKNYWAEISLTQEPSKSMNYYYGISSSNSSYQGLGSSAVVPGKWSHLAVVRDFSPSVLRVTWYINGVKTASATAKYTTAISSTANFIIGDGYLDPFVGKLDEIRIYKGALSTSEVRESYVAGLDALLSKGEISKEEYNNKVMNLATND